MIAKPRKQRQDKLRQSLRERGARLPAGISRLGYALWDVSDDTVAHEECIAALPVFVNAEVDGVHVAGLYPRVRRHLDHCESCSSQYVDLLQVAMADVGDALPQSEAMPSADFSFLEIRRVALKDSVLKWTRQILTTLSPQQIPDLKLIADVFFEQVEALGGKFSLQAGHAEPMALRGSEAGVALAALALSYAAAESLASTLTPQQIDEGSRTGTLEQVVEMRTLSAAKEISLEANVSAKLAREFASQVAKDPASLRALVEK